MKIDDVYNLYVEDKNIVTEKFSTGLLGFGSWNGKKLIEKLADQADSSFKKKLLPDIENLIISDKLFSFKKLLKQDKKVIDEDTSIDPSFAIRWSIGLEKDDLSRLLLGEEKNDKLNGLLFNNYYSDIISEFSISIDPDNEKKYRDIKNENLSGIQEVDGGFVHLIADFNDIVYYDEKISGKDKFNPNYVSLLKGSIYFNVSKSEDIGDYGVKIGDVVWTLERTENMNKPQTLMSSLKEFGQAMKSDAALLAYTAKKAFSSFKTIQNEHVGFTPVKEAKKTENFLLKDKKSSKTSKASIKDATREFLTGIKYLLSNNFSRNSHIAIKIENQNYESGKGAISIIDTDNNIVLSTISFSLIAKKN